VTHLVVAVALRPSVLAPSAGPLDDRADVGP
jgi:hypothetical protein